MSKEVAIFEGAQIRRHYDEEAGVWYFSVVDIVRVLTNSDDYQQARKYWKNLKLRLNKEGSQLVTKCYQLKMTAESYPP